MIFATAYVLIKPHLVTDGVFLVGKIDNAMNT